MTAPFLAVYLGGAFLLALAVALPATGAASLLAGRAAWRWLPFLIATFFFIFLTQHPFPAPGSLHCPVPYMQPKLQPFDFLHILGEGLASPSPWLGKQAAAIGMNFAICAMIGALLARHSRSLFTAILFGLGLPLLVELSQLTGLFGIYPCAYRLFDVDDLILNFAGILSGFLAARAFLRARATKA